MAEPQTTPHEGDTSNVSETSPLEQAGRNEAEQLAAKFQILAQQHRNTCLPLFDFADHSGQVLDIESGLREDRAIRSRQNSLTEGAAVPDKPGPIAERCVLFQERHHQLTRDRLVLITDADRAEESLALWIPRDKFTDRLPQKQQRGKSFLIFLPNERTS